MCSLAEKQQRIATKEREKEAHTRKVEQLHEQLQQHESLIADERATVAHLDRQVHEARDKIEKCSGEFEQVSKQLQDAGIDERESQSEQRKKALIENLKRIFPERVVSPT